MATRTISDRDTYRLHVSADVNGPQAGTLEILTSDGHAEQPVTIGGPGSGAQIAFSELGTAGQRAGFLAICEAARVRARVVLGYA